jgi:site-specific DNA-methyltransferase (adenine-specific)
MSSDTAPGWIPGAGLTLRLGEGRGIKKQKMNKEQKDDLLPSAGIAAMQCYVQPFSEVYNEDCIEVMKRYPDKYFDLAVVDPPYGIDIANLFGGDKRKSGKGCAMKTAFTKKNWDVSIPEMEYFTELFRVSKHQIIWGGNYFNQFLPASMGWIVWNKNNGTTKYSDCEIAFSSFNVALRMYSYTWNGMLQENMKEKETRIHPTQKPVSLYDFCFDFAKVEAGAKILDTHLGSGSSRISANKNGLHFVGCEIDEEYFSKQNKRYADFISQTRLF